MRTIGLEVRPGVGADVMDIVFAVDPRGHRIGYGGGYYDRTLPSYCPPAQSVAVAFSYQLVSELPILPHDVPCSAIATG